MKKLKLKPFQPTEYQDQCVVMEWARLRASQCPALKLLHANLNGLRLPIGLAVKAKRAGMAIGVPDLFLPVPMGLYPGLYIELKRRDGGRLSDAQKWWIEQLRKANFQVEIPAGAAEAIKIISEYLGVK